MSSTAEQEAWQSSPLPTAAHAGIWAQKHDRPNSSNSSTGQASGLPNGYPSTGLRWTQISANTDSNSTKCRNKDIMKDFFSQEWVKYTQVVNYRRFK